MSLDHGNAAAVLNQVVGVRESHDSGSHDDHVILMVACVAHLRKLLPRDTLGVTIKTMIKLAVFDIAGTTVEDPGGVATCFEASLASAGFSRDRSAVNAVMGIPKPTAISQLIGQPENSAIVQQIHADFRDRMMSYYQHDPNVRPISGAAEAFRLLRESGISVALDTGFDRAIVNVILDRLGWGDDLLDATVASDEVESGRPSPDMIFRAMKLTGVDLALHVAKVGDTASDLLSGSAAGCRYVIGVTSGAQTRTELVGHPHTHIVSTVADVAPIIARA